MDFIVIGLPQIPHPNPRCGQRITVDGSLDLAIQFLFDLLRILLLLLHGFLKQYFGGTNFGRTAGGPLVATSYDYDAPIDEHGFLRQPKWGHLRDLHKAIKFLGTIFPVRGYILERTF